MVSRTLKIVMAESKNSQGKSWPPVWIPFHDGVDGVTPIYFHTTPPGSKDPVKESEGLPWDSGRALLDRESFRKWSEDGTLPKGQAPEERKTPNPREEKESKGKGKCTRGSKSKGNPLFTPRYDPY